MAAVGLSPGGGPASKAACPHLLGPPPAPFGCASWHSKSAKQVIEVLPSARTSAWAAKTLCRVTSSEKLQWPSYYAAYGFTADASR